MARTEIFGLIEEDDYGFVTVGGKRLAEEAFENIKGDAPVSVRYFVTDKEVSEEDAVEALITRSLGGECEIDFELDAYSEWTIMEMRHKFIVGGHNILDEVEDYTGKFLRLIIEQE